MSERHSEPVTPDLPPPVGTPDLDTGAEDVIRQNSTGREPDQDVNRDAAAPEPPD